VIVTAFETFAAPDRTVASRRLQSVLMLTWRQFSSSKKSVIDGGVVDDIE
jgi:hypothetical protein